MPPCVTCGKPIGYEAQQGYYVGRTTCAECSGKVEREKAIAAGIPLWYLDDYESLKTFKATTTAEQRAVERCQKLIDPDLLLDRRWILITGGSGLGKSHLAAAVTEEFLRRKVTARFVTFEQLLLEIQECFGPAATRSKLEVVESFATKPGFLALDDLGVERPSQHSIEVLYSILNRRINNRLPTILTSNYPLSKPEPGQPTLGEALSRELSDPTPVKRILDRIAGASTWEHLSGTSKRKLKK